MSLKSHFRASETFPSLGTESSLGTDPVPRLGRALCSIHSEQLEDDELTAHLEREIAADKERKATKVRANEEYHKATAAANIAVRAKREEEQQRQKDGPVGGGPEVQCGVEGAAGQGGGGSEWAVRAAARAHQGDAARVCAHPLRAGADLEKRLKDEEDRKEAEKRAKIEAANMRTTAFLARQLEQKEVALQAERDAAYAVALKADVAKEVEAQEPKKALKAARMSTQLARLNEQVALQRENAKYEVGSWAEKDHNCAPAGPQAASCVRERC